MYILYGCHYHHDIHRNLTDTILAIALPKIKDGFGGAIDGKVTFNLYMKLREVGELHTCLSQLLTMSQQVTRDSAKRVFQGANQMFLFLPWPGEESEHLMILFTTWEEYFLRIQYINAKGPNSRRGNSELPPEPLL